MDFWHAMDTVFHGPDSHNDTQEDGWREAAVKEAWDSLFRNTDHLLLGSRKTVIDLSTFQPPPAQIFRLWQIYLDNVNPLLKVTHTPTLQARVVQAITDVANISANLEALMFSIYCISILSITDTDCQSMFGSSKEHLLVRHQFACQQALINCDYLRTSDRDCLTALYLYLVSVSLNTDPRSLSSMLGVAIRIAKRVGIHSEAVNAKFAPLEAESRRRLWWSLVLFDTRIGEKADHKTTSLDPTWDCSIPLNIYDSDLWREMKETPVVEPKSTEAIFSVVRYELANFIRHSTFYLDFSSPALKPIAKGGPVVQGSAVTAMEEAIEDRFLRFCDPENPLQFMTIWTARSQLAKLKLIEHYSRYLSSPTFQTESQRNTVISYAFQMLQADTKMVASPLTKGYLWLLRIYFPLPAYVHILQDLRRRPLNNLAEKAWEILSESYTVRFTAREAQDTPDNPLYKFFIGLVLQAWEARVAALKNAVDPSSIPSIVSQIRSLISQDAQEKDQNRPEDLTAFTMDDLNMTMSMDFDTHGLFFGMSQEDTRGEAALGISSDPDGSNTIDTQAIDASWVEKTWDLSGQYS